MGITKAASRCAVICAMLTAVGCTQYIDERAKRAAVEQNVKQELLELWIREKARQEHERHRPARRR